jgi:hypothetical protein
VVNANDKKDPVGENLRGLFYWLFLKVELNWAAATIITEMKNSLREAKLDVFCLECL